MDTSVQHQRAPLADHKKWRDDLVFRLRMMDVPGDTIGDIVLEVDAHVRETGERPEDAFGSAKEYAAARAGLLKNGQRTRRKGHVLAGIVQVLLAAAGGFFYAYGFSALANGNDGVLGLSAWFTVLLGAGILALGLWKLPIDLVRHPVTGAPLLVEDVASKLVMAAIVVLGGVALYLVTRFLL